MNRRQFLLTSGAVLAGVTAGTAVWLHGVKVPSLAETRARLAALRGTALHSGTAWAPAQVFAHLAQSIEYSMSGYPQLKPELFRKTVGPAAFAAFGAVGQMRHPLTEAIPGAPALDGSLAIDAALDRLLAAIDTFDQHQGALEPHFVFGPLSHAQFAVAHVLHIENHLTELAPAAART